MFVLAPRDNTGMLFINTTAASGVKYNKLSNINVTSARFFEFLIWGSNRKYTHTCHAQHKLSVNVFI